VLTVRWCCLHTPHSALQLCFFAHTPEQLRVTAKSLAAQQAQANSGKGKRSKAAQQAKALSANSSAGELLAQMASTQPLNTDAAAAAAAATVGSAAAAAALGSIGTDPSSISTQAQHADSTLGPAAAAAQLLRSMLTDEAASSALMQQLNAVGDDTDALDDATAAAILTMLDQLERQQLGGSTGSQSSSPASEDSTSSPPRTPVGQTIQLPALAFSAQRKDTAPMAGAAASASASAGPVFGFGMDTAGISSSTRPLSWQPSSGFSGRLKPAQLSVQEHISAVMQGRVPLQDTARVLDVSCKPSPAAAAGWGHTGGLLGLSPAHSFNAAGVPANNSAAFLQSGASRSLPSHAMQGIGLGVSPSAAAFMHGACPAAAAGSPCGGNGFDPDGLLFPRQFASPVAMGAGRAPLAVSPGGPAGATLQAPGMCADVGFLSPTGVAGNSVPPGLLQTGADAALCRMLSGGLSSSSNTCASSSSNMVMLVGADRTVRRCSVDALPPALMQQLSLQQPAQQGLVGGFAVLGQGMGSPHMGGPSSSLMSALSTPADFAAMAAAVAQRQQLEAQQTILLMQQQQQQQQHGMHMGLPRPAFAGLDLAAGHMGAAPGQQLGGAVPGMAGVGFPANCSPATASRRVGMPA
jgi:hypothetical protein